ncbi:MAG: VWA domain-containing protein, partial [Myxococcales bacterium]
MSSRQRRAWAVGWLCAALFVGAVASMLYLESRYQLLITDEQLRFERPWAALLLLAVPLVWLSRVWVQRASRPRLLFSRAGALRNGTSGWRNRIVDLPSALRGAALALVVVGLAGPQSIHARDTAEVSGIEIMLALDMSRSMEAADIRPTRFRATKAVVRDFIDRRPNDRIGAVVFGRDAYTLLPL